MDTALAYSIAETAKLCSISRSQVNVLLADGLLRAKKCGVRTLILRSTIEAFLEDLPPHLSKARVE